MKQVAIRFTQEQWEGLVRLATDEGHTSVAAYLRQHVQALIDGKSALSSAELQARHEGMAAAHAPGAAMLDCPYDPYTREACQWMVGFSTVRSAR